MRSMDPDYFKRLEQFIDDYMDEYSRSPTTREIAAGTGRALSTVHKYLSQDTIRNQRTTESAFTLRIKR